MDVHQKNLEQIDSLRDEYDVDEHIQEINGDEILFKNGSIYNICDHTLQTGSKYTVIQNLDIRTNIVCAAFRKVRSGVA